jgi:hypothetical protein
LETERWGKEQHKPNIKKHNNQNDDEEINKTNQNLETER